MSHCLTYWQPTYNTLIMFKRRNSYIHTPNGEPQLICVHSGDYQRNSVHSNQRGHLVCGSCKTHLRAAAVSHEEILYKGPGEDTGSPVTQDITRFTVVFSWTGMCTNNPNNTDNNNRTKKRSRTYPRRKSRAWLIPILQKEKFCGAASSERAWTCQMVPKELSSHGFV